MLNDDYRKGKRWNIWRFKNLVNVRDFISKKPRLFLKSRKIIFIFEYRIDLYACLKMLISFFYYLLNTHVNKILILNININNIFFCKFS